VRSTLALLSAAAVALLGGCGAARDMRSQYVANRAFRDATDELRSDSPHLAEVRANLDLAYRLRANDPRFLQRLAGPYQDAGGFEKALRCYEAGGALTHEDYDIEIGSCLLKLGRMRPGTERLERALKRAAGEFADGQMDQTRYAGVLNNVGYALVEADVKVEEASKLIQEAVSIAPLVPAYVDSLGWAYYRRGRYEEAAFYLERAARLWRRDDPEILWHLGAVHARLGRYRRAESELTRALALDPSNQEARRVLRGLLHELPPPASA